MDPVIDPETGVIPQTEALGRLMADRTLASEKRVAKAQDERLALVARASKGLDALRNAEMAGVGSSMVFLADVGTGNEREMVYYMGGRMECLRSAHFAGHRNPARCRILFLIVGLALVVGIAAIPDGPHLTWASVGLKCAGLGFLLLGGAAVCFLSSPDAVVPDARAEPEDLSTDTLRVVCSTLDRAAVKATAILAEERLGLARETEGL